MHSQVLKTITVVYGVFTTTAIKLDSMAV